MYKCEECGKFLKELKKEYTSWESEYGIGEGSCSPLILYCCPHCGSNVLSEEVEEDMEYEEKTEKYDVDAIVDDYLMGISEDN